MDNTYYKLEGKKIVPCKDVLEWGEWFGINDRIVKQTTLPTGEFISTVFLGINHAFMPDMKPQLFETMIFKGEHDQYQERYSTWDEAEAGHEKAIQMIFEAA